MDSKVIIRTDTKRQCKMGSKTGKKYDIWQNISDFLITQLFLTS